MKTILITPGEPAGIGPDVVIQLIQKKWAARLVVIADPNCLIDRAKQLNLPLKLIEYSPDALALHEAQTIQIIPIQLKEKVKSGLLNINHAEYVLHCLQLASTLCIQICADAWVTGPVQKSLLNEAGFAFTGHTEYLAQLCKAPQTVMLFVVNQLKVALATTHLPLAQVPQAITKEKLSSVLTILSADLMKWFDILHPRLLVCGLNPHAGEGGHLGREEIEVITPTLQTLTAKGLQLMGPLPADTIFTAAYIDQADAILALYHDQALPLIKYIGFNHAVNVTLGLPYLRTSVDHGTALALAGTGQADPGSMCAATQLAINLAKI